MDCVSRGVWGLYDFKNEKSYLEVFGAIEICYLFQQSMKYLSKMFNIPYERNKAFGDSRNSLLHPIDRDGNKSFSINLKVGLFLTYIRDVKDFIEAENFTIISLVLPILTQLDELLF